MDQTIADLPGEEPPGNLPPYLLNWEPLEIEHLPLQVALLTMEMAALVQRLTAAETALGALAAIGLLTGQERCQGPADG
jgi:hypothetical protein